MLVIQLIGFLAFMAGAFWVGLRAVWAALGLRRRLRLPPSPADRFADAVHQVCGVQQVAGLWERLQPSNRCVHEGCSLKHRTLVLPRTLARSSLASPALWPALCCGGLSSKAQPRVQC